MAYSRGRGAVRRFIAELPEQIENNLLKGAGRAAVKVVADEARLQVTSDRVRAAIKTRVGKAEGYVLAKVLVKGPGSYIAPWLEYGTARHFISVDDSQRNGMSVSRINELESAGSLVINGNFVGKTVLHPGARPHPFMRPALDTKGAQAIAAAQGYINAHVTRSGIRGSSEPEGSDE